MLCLTWMFSQTEADFPPSDIQTRLINGRNELEGTVGTTCVPHINNVMCVCGTAADGIAEFNTLPSPGPAAKPSYDAALASMNGALDNLNALIPAATCPVMGYMYVDTRNALCRQVAPGLAILFILQVRRSEAGCCIPVSPCMCLCLRWLCR